MMKHFFSDNPDVFCIIVLNVFHPTSMFHVYMVFWLVITVIFLLLQVLLGYRLCLRDSDHHISCDTPGICREVLHAEQPIALLLVAVSLWFVHSEHCLYFDPIL